MWKTASLLLVTIIVVPFLAFRFDEPLTMGQLEILHPLLLVYLVAAGLCFIVSSITSNHSQVDKLWSLIPIVYVWMIAFAANMEPRLVLMAVMVTIWGLRLSYNFWRRGGYSIRFWSGEEDYRWAVLRATPGLSGRLRWSLFNLLFISYYQMGIVLLMTLPALKSAGASPISFTDYIIAAVLLLLVVIETVADQQQWNYHKRRREAIDSGSEPDEELKKGFTHRGLWKWSRHPNYAAEQAFWLVFYLFSVSATGDWLNWSVTGSLLLVLLFVGSSNFSESISAGKYPEYEEYRAKTARFIPFL